MHIQQNQIEFKPQPSQMLEENRNLEQLFKLHFQKDKQWMTSKILENQTMQAFLTNFQTILNEISTKKQLTQKIQFNLMGIHAFQIQNLEILLQTKQDQFENVAKLLLIKLIFIITPSNKQWEFGVKNYQVVKIILQTQNHTPQFSFIVGLSLDKYQQQIPALVPLNQQNQQIPLFVPLYKKLQQIAPNVPQNQQYQRITPNVPQNQQYQQITPNVPQNQQYQQITHNVPQNNQKFLTPCPLPHDMHSQRIYTPNLGIQKKFPFQIQPTQNLSPNFPNSQEKQEQQEEDFVLTTSQISEKHKEKDKPISQLNLSHNIPNQINSIWCEICFETYKKTNENQIILPCCQKIIHKDCVENELAQTGDFFWNIKCYFCQKPYAMSFLKEIIGFKKFQENVKKQIIEKCVDACFKCKAKFPILPQQQEKLFVIKCQYCQIEICSKCRKEFHGIQSDCQNIRQELLRVFQGEPVIVCWNCDLIQTKGDGCDHIQCDQCKNDLCALCSVDRRPIVGHGNHFHRRGCPYFAIEYGKESMTEEKNRVCELCKTSGKACKLPIDLDTYKKLKGYK